MYEDSRPDFEEHDDDTLTRDCLLKVCLMAVYRGMDHCAFHNWQPVRLPGGWNRKYGYKQRIIEWNL